MLFRKKNPKAAVNTNIPAHIAIIMDGNGRWAKKRGLPRTAGHSAGSENFRRMATYMKNIGVKYLTVYAFSTENWGRPQEEVDAIMALFQRYLLEAISDMAGDNIRLRFFGDTLSLPQGLRELIQKTNEISDTTDGFLVNVCANYGGRAEIVRATRLLAEKCRRGEIGPEEISEQIFASHLYSADVPDPDLIIRPGAEQRISNFLLWQSAYSEYYFTDVLWPDFNEAELGKAIADYNSRNRRFGGI